MMTTTTTQPPLGQTVSRVLSLMYMEDPLTAALPSGTETVEWQGRCRWAQSIVQRAGYQSYEAFLDAVERRTTEHWVAESGLSALMPEGN